VSAMDQLVTFFVGEHLLGLPVECVQEVKGQTPLESVPLAPTYVHGLINLRGDIVTALNVRALLHVEGQLPMNFLCVICHLQEHLVSLTVDSIGDVIHVDDSQIEDAPANVPEGLRKYIKCIYKTESKIVSVLDVTALAEELSPSASLLFSEIA
jgi:purine-binding chemotaxis protein CheW